MKRNLILLLTLCHSTLLIYSQNTPNSPTSMFGLGELSTGEGGQYSGLGGAGIALQSYNFLNIANPASLTAIEGQRFLIDAGVMGAYKVYTQTGTSNHSLVGNLNNLSIGCRITPRCRLCHHTGSGHHGNRQFHRIVTLRRRRRIV